MTKKYVTGLDDVLKNLNKEVAKIEGRTLKGLIKFAIVIRRSMDKVSPKIPVDLGNLRSSFFLLTSEGKVHSGNPTTEARTLSMKAMDGPYVVFGFSANYAVYVHEMKADFNWNRPGSGPKFLENALDRNKLDGLYIIGKEAKIP